VTLSVSTAYAVPKASFRGVCRTKSTTPSASTTTTASQIAGVLPNKSQRRHVHCSLLKVCRPGIPDATPADVRRRPTPSRSDGRPFKNEAAALCNAVDGSFMFAKGLCAFGQCDLTWSRWPLSSEKPPQVCFQLFNPQSRPFAASHPTSSETNNAFPCNPPQSPSFPNTLRHLQRKTLVTHKYSIHRPSLNPAVKPRFHLRRPSSPCPRHSTDHADLQKANSPWHCCL
jgi:hypothetical protein